MNNENIEIFWKILFTLMRSQFCHMYIHLQHIQYDNKRYEKIQLYHCLDHICMHSTKAPDPNINTMFTKEYSSQGCALAVPSGPWRLTFAYGWQGMHKIIMLGTLSFIGSEFCAPKNLSCIPSLTLWILSVVM